MERVLITGAAGFVGSQLAIACLEAGYEVHAVVRAADVGRRLAPIEGQIVRHGFDLRSRDAVRRCIRDVQPRVIFHLAARTRWPDGSEVGNSVIDPFEERTTLSYLLAAAAAARRPPDAFIRAGSLAEYGPLPAPYLEDMAEAPCTPYGAALLAATHHARSMQPDLPFPVATARLALVYGPAQSSQFLVPWLIERCLAGDRSLVRRPSDRRDLLHVSDAVSGLMRMATTPLPDAAIINLATGNGPTMREAAALIVHETGADPGLVEYGDNSPPSGAADLRGCTDRATRLLGWHPAVPLSEGIAATVAWYRDHHAGMRFSAPVHSAGVEIGASL